MDPHRRATQTRLLRLAHAVKCRRQRSPCRRQQLRREALPPCALLHRVQALGSENLNRLNLVLVSAGCQKRMTLLTSGRMSGPMLRKATRKRPDLEGSSAVKAPSRFVGGRRLQHPALLALLSLIHI